MKFLLGWTSEQTCEQRRRGCMARCIRIVWPVRIMHAAIGLETHLRIGQVCSGCMGCIASESLWWKSWACFKNTKTEKNSKHIRSVKGYLPDLQHSMHVIRTWYFVCYNYLNFWIHQGYPWLPMNHDLHMTRDRASKAVFSRKMSGTLIFLRGFGVCDPGAAFVVGA